jgi:hypothetical protein
MLKADCALTFGDKGYSSEPNMSRTARFAQFLRAAVAIKTKTVTEVNKYPTVIWFSRRKLLKGRSGSRGSNKRCVNHGLQRRKFLIRCLATMGLALKLRDASGMSGHVLLGFRMIRFHTRHLARDSHQGGSNSLSTIVGSTRSCVQGSPGRWSHSLSPGKTPLV